jgi:hypothetical protein
MARIVTGCDHRQLIRDPQTSTEHPAIKLGAAANSDDDGSARSDRSPFGSGSTNIHFVAELLQLSDREAASLHSMLR